MKKILLTVVCFLALCSAITPVYAGGDKNQNEHEQEKGDPNGDATSPGSDAQGNQSS